MIAASLVLAVEKLGGRLIVDGDDIEIEVAAGALSAQVVENLRAHKAELLTVLRDRNRANNRERFLPITRRHPPATWDADDWREYFDERLAVAMIDGQQPVAAARRIAWECCITRWRDLHPVASEPSHCAHCGKPDEPGNIVPFGTDPHAWLHPGCWSGWDHTQREAAELALHEVIGTAHHDC